MTQVLLVDLVNKNGELMAKLEQQISSKNDHEAGGRPDTKVQLSVDIPSKGVHKQTVYSSDGEPLRKRDSKYREYDKKNYVRVTWTIYFKVRQCDARPQNHFYNSRIIFTSNIVWQESANFNDISRLTIIICFMMLRNVLFFINKLNMVIMYF